MKRLKILLTTISIIGLFGLLLSCPADNKSPADNKGPVETFNYDHLKGEWESNSLGWLVIISNTKLEVKDVISYDILSVDSKKFTVKNPYSGATENIGYEKINDGFNGYDGNGSYGSMWEQCSGRRNMACRDIR